MRRILLLIAAIVALFWIMVVENPEASEALCSTDTQCAMLCPKGEAGAECRANILD